MSMKWFDICAPAYRGETVSQPVYQDVEQVMQARCMYKKPVLCVREETLL